MEQNCVTDVRPRPIRRKKMCKFNPKNDSRFIDQCMENIVFVLQKRFKVPIVACCCGHKKYPMTIVLKDEYGVYELFSGEEILKKKKFYKKDKQGHYYIPEMINNKVKKND